MMFMIMKLVKVQIAFKDLIPRRSYHTKSMSSNYEIDEPASYHAKTRKSRNQKGRTTTSRKSRNQKPANINEKNQSEIKKKNRIVIES